MFLTFPEESGDDWRFSNRLATSNLPYFEARWRGVNPFCKQRIEMLNFPIQCFQKTPQKQLKQFSLLHWRT